MQCQTPSHFFNGLYNTHSIIIMKLGLVYEIWWIIALLTLMHNTPLETLRPFWHWVPSRRMWSCRTDATCLPWWRDLPQSILSQDWKSMAFNLKVLAMMGVYGKDLTWLDWPAFELCHGFPRNPQDGGWCKRGLKFACHQQWCDVNSSSIRHVPGAKHGTWFMVHPVMGT